MAQLYENIGHIFLLLILLCFSAFFSGSETAYFSLSRRQIEQLRRSRQKLSHLAGLVIGQERKLLSALLFGNMTVNVLFFAITSVLVLRLEKQFGAGSAVIAGAVAFSLLLVFGEIFPKSVAYGRSKSFSVAAAIPTYLCLKVLTPIASVFRILIVEPALRLLLGPVRKSDSIGKEEFRSLMEQMKRRGLITTEENRLLGEIVELSLLRVKHCMRPRVDMVACSVDSSPEDVEKLLRQNRLTKISVYSGKLDNIVGYVELRDLLLRPESKVKDIVRKVDFVPEQKSIESLLEDFRKRHTDTAVVVDEYGGLAGLISLEDIAEEVLGPMDSKSVREMVESIGPLRYRLAGDLPIHEWGHSFGVDVAEARYSTIGGLVTALLSRIPKEQDTVRLNNMKFTIEKVSHNRVESLILEFEPLNLNGK